MDVLRIFERIFPTIKDRKDRNWYSPYWIFVAVPAFVFVTGAADDDGAAAADLVA